MSKKLIEVWRHDSLKLILPPHLSGLKWSADAQVLKSYYCFYIKIWQPSIYFNFKVKSLYIPCKWNGNYYRVMVR